MLFFRLLTHASKKQVSKKKSSYSSFSNVDDGLWFEQEYFVLFVVFSMYGVRLLTTNSKRNPKNGSSQWKRATWSANKSREEAYCMTVYLCMPIWYVWMECCIYSSAIIIAHYVSFKAWWSCQQHPMVLIRICRHVKWFQLPRISWCGLGFGLQVMLGREHQIFQSDFVMHRAGKWAMLIFQLSLLPFHDDSANVGRLNFFSFFLVFLKMGYIGFCSNCKNQSEKWWIG